MTEDVGVVLRCYLVDVIDGVGVIDDVGVIDGVGVIVLDGVLVGVGDGIVVHSRQLGHQKSKRLNLSFSILKLCCI